MRKWVLTVAAPIVALGLFAAGCGGSSSSSPSSSPSSSSSTTASSGKPLKVGAVLPGPINDHGYDQAMYQGLTTIKRDLGAKINYVENASDPSAALSAMNNLAVSNNLVIVAGGEFANLMHSAASQHPSTQFVLIDGAPANAGSNVHAYLVNYAENGYLAGVVAANLTQTHRVAFIGGLDIPPTENAGIGFGQGVKTASGVKDQQTSIGTFNDPAKAREAASAQIASGADVLFPFVDAAYPGVLHAASAKTKVILSDRITTGCNESHAVAGETRLNGPSLITRIAKDFQANKLPTQPEIIGLANGVVGMDLCPSTTDPKAVAALKKADAAIRSGSVTIKLK